MNQTRYFWLRLVLLGAFIYFLLAQTFYCWNANPLWKAVPADAALVLAFQDSLDTKAQLANLAAIYPFQQLQKDASYLDSLGVEKRNLLAVLQASTPEVFNWLFIQKTAIDLAQQFAKLGLSPKVSILHDTRVYHLPNRFAVATYDGLLFIAPYPLQVEQAIEQVVNQKSLWKNRSLRKLHQLESEAVVHCYLSLNNLPNFLAPYMDREARPLVKQLTLFRDWLRLDIQRDSVGTQLMGQWLPKERSFRNSLKSIKNEAKILNILPDNTALYVWGDLKEMLREYQLELPQLGKLWGHIADEAALSFSEAYAPTAVPSPFLIFRLKHEGAANDYLQELARLGNIQPEDYQMFQVFRVRAANYAYFTLIQDYLIFSKDLEHLQTYVDKYIVGQVLANDIDFLRAIADNKGQSTAAFYAHTQRISPFLQQIFKKNHRKSLQNNIRALHQTEGLQLTFSQSGRFKGRIAQPEILDNVSIIWRSNLDTIARTAPQLIQFSGRKYIVIQDAAHRLYCLDETGEVHWTKALSEPILSNFQAVDYYDNEQQQYFFNTAQNIHLINEVGEEVGEFPLGLQSAATNGLRTVDFDQTGFHHFFVACENGNVYGFDQTGRPLEHWSPRFIGLVLHPIEHFQWKQKDFILILNQIGKLHVLARDGSARFAAQSIAHPRQSLLAYQAESESPRIIVADTSGNIQVTHPRGESFNLPLEVGNNEQVQTVFADLWGDERKDYVVLSGRKMAVYGYDERGFKKRAGGTFEYAQDEIFAVKDGTKTYLGMLNKAAAQIVLFTSEQRPERGFPLAGTTSFFVDDLFGQRERILVVGNEDSVYAYRVKRNQ